MREHAYRDLWLSIALGLTVGSVLGLLVLQAL